MVAEHYGVTEKDIIGNKRSSKIVIPRQIAMYLCRELTGTSLKGIGKIIGNRDHTTVMHGIEKIENELSTNESLRNTVNILKKKINPQN
jgi:chromosomal replication initiator protein